MSSCKSWDCHWYHQLWNIKSINACIKYWKLNNWNQDGQLTKSLLFLIVKELTHVLWLEEVNCIVWSYCIPVVQTKKCDGIIFCRCKTIVDVRTCKHSRLVFTHWSDHSLPCLRMLSRSSLCCVMYRKCPVSLLSRKSLIVWKLLLDTEQWSHSLTSLIHHPN